MNKNRRRLVREAIDHLQRANELLAQVGEEEEESFDNLPESIQESERGEEMQSNIDTLDEANSTLDELMETLEDL